MLMHLPIRQNVGFDHRKGLQIKLGHESSFAKIRLIVKTGSINEIALNRRKKKEKTFFLAIVVFVSLSQHVVAQSRERRKKR